MDSVAHTQASTTKRRPHFGGLFRGDTVIWVVFVLLSAISLLAVYSSIGLEAYTHFTSKTPTTLFLRHFVIVLLSYVVVIVFSHTDYRYFSRFSVLFYWLSLALLALMLALHGRWLRVPIIGQFQPSEIAKVALIVFIARLMALKKDSIRDLGTFFMLLVYVVLVAALVFPENFSTAALIFLSVFLMMLFGGVNKTYWWRMFIIGIAAVGIFLAVSYNRYERSLNSQGDNPTIETTLQRQSTWGHRLYSFVNPDYAELSQANMAKMAIARGGLMGAGVGQTIHARLMTQAHNDFIFAIIIEECGLFAGMGVFILYCILYFRCIMLFMRCKGRFGALVAVGLGTMIFLQALVNMCVAVGVLPVTGQTLPFISYGGTSYLLLALSLGIIQSVAADVKRQKYQEQKEATPVANTPETEPANNE
ncbi:MAG: FtsW/RodA/SpoVE family cell cycle protein [Bacteroidales bacterium]|nr:FtsW/RodA/SpoVE family cell cycle protein [Bacteroidales bacterium]